MPDIQRLWKWAAGFSFYYGNYLNFPPRVQMLLCEPAADIFPPLWPWLMKMAYYSQRSGSLKACALTWMMYCVITGTTEKCIGQLTPAPVPLQFSDLIPGRNKSDANFGEGIIRILDLFENCEPSVLLSSRGLSALPSLAKYGVFCCFFITQRTQRAQSSYSQAMPPPTIIFCFEIWIR